MYPIILRSEGNKQGYSLEEFDRAFISICQSHRESGRALAFAFILFDYTHPEVRKVLEDQAYWDALDHISGVYLTVFSFHLKSRLKRRTNPRKSNHGSNHDPGLEDPNRFVDSRFGIKLPRSRPLLLFFQVRDHKISRRFIYELKADSVEIAFSEIRDALVDAVESVEHVLPEYRNNTEEIFREMENSLSQRKLLRKLSGIMKTVRHLKDWLGK